MSSVAGPGSGIPDSKACTATLAAGKQSVGRDSRERASIRDARRGTQFMAASHTLPAHAPSGKALRVIWAPCGGRASTLKSSVSDSA